MLSARGIQSLLPLLARLPSLSSLDLSVTALGDDSLAQLRLLLEQCRSLQSLDISACELSCMHDFTALKSAVAASPSLRHLAVGGNPLRERAVHQLLQLPAVSSVRSLDLSNLSSCQEYAAAAVADFLVCRYADHDRERSSAADREYDGVALCLVGWDDSITSISAKLASAMRSPLCSLSALNVSFCRMADGALSTVQPIASFLIFFSFCSLALYFLLFLRVHPCVSFTC